MPSVRNYLSSWAILRYPEFASALDSQECFGGPQKLVMYADLMPKRPRDVVRRWDKMHLMHCQIQAMGKAMSK